MSWLCMKTMAANTPRAQLIPSPIFNSRGKYLYLFVWGWRRGWAQFKSLTDYSSPYSLPSPICSYSCCSISSISQDCRTMSNQAISYAIYQMVMPFTQGISCLELSGKLSAFLRTQSIRFSYCLALEDYLLFLSNSYLLVRYLLDNRSDSVIIYCIWWSMQVFKIFSALGKCSIFIAI